VSITTAIVQYIAIKILQNTVTVLFTILCTVLNTVYSAHNWNKIQYPDNLHWCTLVWMRPYFYCNKF